MQGKGSNLKSDLLQSQVSIAMDSTPKCAQNPITFEQANENLPPIFIRNN